MCDSKKRKFGQYDTCLFNPFSFHSFKEWVKKNNLQYSSVLEPFAGKNMLVDFLNGENIGSVYCSYDIEPRHPYVGKRDTIKDFPTGHSFCVTNPPWFYKSSAHRRGYDFDTAHDDLYKECLEKCLMFCKYVALLLPASFLQCGIFRERLSRIIFINTPIFENTEHPVCLALFNEKESDDVVIFEEDTMLGTLNRLGKHLPPKNRVRVRFNDPNGSLGAILVDSKKKKSIRFCHGDALKNKKIKDSSRSFTRISGIEVVDDDFIRRLNSALNAMRLNTHDVFLTPFKGLRDDGKYRRRLDFKLARALIASVL